MKSGTSLVVHTSLFYANVKKLASETVRYEDNVHARVLDKYSLFPVPLEIAGKSWNLNLKFLVLESLEITTVLESRGKKIMEFRLLKRCGI